MTETNSFLDLNQFIKDKKIGRGSFGTVYKVEQKSTGNIYAAKISLNPLTEDQKSLNIYLQREVNIIAQLNHPSILKFIGYSPINFKKEPNPVIVTEYSSNGSLNSILKLERQSLSPQQWNDTKKLINIYGIASAMSYLHSNNIIHRDLKPENILEDDYLFPKIADFGLSKIYHSNKDSVSLASTAGLKGTPIYIPPESWVTNEYSKSGDVYAFSLIVYEIMTLEEPFKNFDLPTFIIRVIQNHERPKFPQTIKECYKNLITCCWSENPSERPTFDEIVSELKNNKEFIIDTIDKDEYFDYIDYIENWHITFDTSKKFTKITLSKDDDDNDDDKKNIFEELKKIGSFNNLSNETQEFFKKQNLNSKTLTLQPSDSTVLFVDGLFDSKDFINVLKFFEKIVINVKYPMNIFKQFVDLLSKLATNELKSINLKILATELTKIKSFKKLQSIPHSIEIINSIPLIDKKEFYYLSSLTQITIPSSVKSFENSAFEGCYSLKQILIPSSVNSIGKRSFFKCTSLNQIEFEKPTSVTSIGEGAFSECSSLKQMLIPSSVKSVGKRSFYKCSSLVQVKFDIPSSVTSIGEGAFSECPSLNQIVIPSSINSILSNSLKGLSSLIEITDTELKQKVKQDGENVKGINANDNVDAEKVKEIDDDEICLLLCGPSESGKTTMIRQLKSKFKDGISEDEKKSYAQIIRANVIEAMQQLIMWTEMNDKEISSEYEDFSSFICDINPFDCEFTQQLADKLKKLFFNDPAIQEAFKNSEETIIPDNIDYFYSKIDELVSDDYIPSYDDVLRARIRSINVDEIELSIDGTFVRIFDVGGQKNERKKWCNVSENVSGVVFCISLMDYIKPCFENPSIIRINDALELFKEITHLKKFQEVPFFLICNKYDMFQSKIEKTDSFLRAFPDFKGDPHNVRDCSNHIIHKFICASSPQSPYRPIITFTQSSLDGDQVICNLKEFCKFMIHNL